MMKVRHLFVQIAAASLAACTVGPDYERPQIDHADVWLEPAELSAVDMRWWDNFDDPMLVRLIDMAVAGNPDLREAEARLAEARANRDAVRGGRVPEIEANGSVTENVLSRNGQLPVNNIPGFDREFPLFDFGFDASWELDFWGRRTRQIEAAEARAAEALEARRDVLITLIGEIARGYVDLRAAQAGAALQSQAAEAEAGRAALADQRYRAGESSRLEAERAAALAATAAQAVPQAQARAAAAAYRIATLVGRPPEDIVPELRGPAPLPGAPEQIFVGIRSDLLERRPDVRQAERELAATTADIGVATADFFPRFSLFGSLGSQARDPGDLFSTDSLRLGIGPSFSWPIFSGGRIRAQIRAADARTEAAAARYEAAVIGALSDSESAINGYLRAQETTTEAERALAAERAATELARQRFEAGEDNRSDWLAAQLQLAERETGALDARAAELQSAIALYKALGGGWSVIEADIVQNNAAIREEPTASNR